MIKISEKSKKMINEVFSRYKEVELPSILDGIKIDGRTIIHTYPTSDTQDDNDDELDGFIDALLFDVHIFDVDKSLVYKSKGHDRIDYYGFNIISQEVFKDGSTMIIIDTPVKIHLGQAIGVFNRKEEENYGH